MSRRRRSQWRKAGSFPASSLSVRLVSHRGNCCRNENQRPRAQRSPTFRVRRPCRCLQLSFAPMRRLHPRSPYEKLGGYVHLPRLIDKARLHRKGLLNGYNYKTVGFDKHLLAFLKLNGDEFEEIANRFDDDAEVLNWVDKNGTKHSADAIEHWNQEMISRHPDTAAKRARFNHFLKEAGGAGRKDIKTYFDLIEFDEGRLK